MKGKSRECKAPGLGPGLQICNSGELFDKLLLCASHPSPVNGGEARLLPAAIPLPTVTAFKRHQLSP